MALYCQLHSTPTPLPVYILIIRLVHHAANNKFADPNKDLRLQRIPHTLRTSTSSRQNALLKSTACSLLLPHLRHRIDDSTYEAHKDGAHTWQGDGCVKEDEARYCDWEFVQGAYHGIRCTARDSDAVRRGVGDEDRGEPGEDHG